VAEPAVQVAELNKTFLVPEREAGLRASMKSLVRRRHREVRAVDDIAFEIGQGEVVGFLGPNGAGKTTTLKMLSGLLYPTSGEAHVLGHVPSKRERVTFLVPLAFAITVPAEAVTSRLDWSTVGLAVGFAAALFVFTRWWWGFGLRRYSGASA